MVCFRGNTLTNPDKRVAFILIINNNAHHKKNRMTWPNSAVAAMTTHSGSSVSTPQGPAGAPESALKGGGCRRESSLALLASSTCSFGGVINRCCAVSRGFKFCRTQHNFVTKSAQGLFLPSV